MYKDLTQIQVLQIDHTTRCNLRCPECARMCSKTNELNPRMPISDLTVQDYEILLEPFDPNKISLFHCGNFGDVIASPTFDETLDYSLSRVNHITVSTNGSARNINWWTDLAKKSNNKITVVFSIDGLEDTNHLYRVGSNYKKIIDNATAFINAGGRARWNFIEFPHNQHQIDAARQLSKDLGFRQFSHKRSTRSAGVPMQVVHKHQTQDFNTYVQNTNVTCKFQKIKYIFVDTNLNLWPCCWFGDIEYQPPTQKQRKDLDKLWSMYGKDFNSIRTHGWKVLDHEFFQQYLENSWADHSEQYQRLYPCGKMCGNTVEFSSGYGKNINITKHSTDSTTAGN